MLCIPVDLEGSDGLDVRNKCFIRSELICAINKWVSMLHKKNSIANSEWNNPRKYAIDARRVFEAFEWSHNFDLINRREQDNFDVQPSNQSFSLDNNKHNQAYDFVSLAWCIPLYQAIFKLYLLFGGSSVCIFMNAFICVSSMPLDVCATPHTLAHTCYCFLFCFCYSHSTQNIQFWIWHVLQGGDKYGIYLNSAWIKDFEKTSIQTQVQIGRNHHLMNAYQNPFTSKSNANIWNWIKLRSTVYAERVKTRSRCLLLHQQSYFEHSWITGTERRKRGTIIICFITFTSGPNAYAVCIVFMFTLR